jgi:hypothetical protein
VRSFRAVARGQNLGFSRRWVPRGPLGGCTCYCGHSQTGVDEWQLSPPSNEMEWTPPSLRGNKVGIGDVAQASCTIGYELMCAMARGMPIEVIEN